MFRINLKPWNTFSASSVDAAISMAKDIYKNQSKALQIAKINGAKSPLAFMVLGKRKISPADIAKCLDTVKSEWRSIQSIAVAAFMKNSYVLKVIRSKKIDARAITSSCVMTEIDISLADSVPSVSYQFSICDTALKGFSVAVMHCPYGKYDESKASIRVGTASANNDMMIQQQIQNQQWMNQNVIDQMNRDSQLQQNIVQQNIINQQMFF